VKAVDAAIYRILFVTICRAKRASAVFFAEVEPKRSVRALGGEGVRTTLLKNLTRLREISP
jgi:hypothetical protein